MQIERQKLQMDSFGRLDMLNLCEEFPLKTEIGTIIDKKRNQSEWSIAHEYYTKQNDPAS
ncbi:hypothetical protein NCCP133_24150 [Cytobacillus sp. NCCP-133]|nr:hypothetical protein NCCP133_24150 [Cytobacillus sp. NCCP-133]